MSYTVPQKIRVGAEAVDVFFRVRKNYGAAQIEVASGGSVLAAFKRLRMAPGEMENVRLSSEVLQKAGDELTFSIREA